MWQYLKVFQILEIIVRKYSKQPVKELIDNYLRIKIVTHIDLKSLQTIFDQLELSKPDRVIFSKQFKEKRKKYFVLLFIDHPKYFDLSQKIMQTVQECVVILDNLKQVNNILNKQNQSKPQNATKAVLLRLQKLQLQQFIQSIDAYLSICQLFQGHLHLIVSCFEAPIDFDFKSLLKFTCFDDDQFQGLSQDGYFRILQERASRITLDQLSNSCSITRCFWGEMLVFQGGYDGIIVWVTQNFMPKLEVIPPIMLPVNKQKQMPLFIESEMGFKIFKNKKVWKQKLQNLTFTTVIFNFKKYQKSYNLDIMEQFTEFNKKFFASMSVSSQLALFNEHIKHGQRICELLNIDGIYLLKKMMQF